MSKTNIISTIRWVKLTPSCKPTQSDKLNQNHQQHQQKSWTNTTINTIELNHHHYHYPLLRWVKPTLSHKPTPSSAPSDELNQRHYQHHQHHPLQQMSKTNTIITNTINTVLYLAEINQHHHQQSHLLRPVKPTTSSTPTSFHTSKPNTALLWKENTNPHHLFLETKPHFSPNHIIALL